MKTLKGKSNISSIFSNATKIASSPLNVRFIESDEDALLVSAPIKKWKNATDRNRIKRVMKDAMSKWEKPLIGHWALIWYGKNIPSSDDVLKLLNKIKL